MSEVFHSSNSKLRKQVHLVLVRPQRGENVGAAARAYLNMGFEGTFRIVADASIPSVLDDRARAVARHATSVLEQSQIFDSLGAALSGRGPRSLALASTARSGSPDRPHPMRVRDAVARAMGKLQEGSIESLFLVFGPESDGLTNSEIGECDWVVSIPSSAQYSSLNLGQSTLVFLYEANMALLAPWEPYVSEGGSQKGRVIANLLALGEEAGFILPGDPFKMRPRLEEIFSALPNHIKDVKTLHGFIDQVRRSLRRGEPDMKGRFKSRSERLAQEERHGREDESRIGT